MMPHDFSVLDFCKKCGATRTEASHDGKLTPCPGRPVSLEAGVRLGRGGPAPSQSAPHPLAGENWRLDLEQRQIQAFKEANNPAAEHVFDPVTFVCVNCGITKKLTIERGPIVCPLEPSTAFDMLRKMDLEKMAPADGVYDVPPPIKKEPPVLFPDGDFLFEVDKGKEYHDGKAHWPAHIRIQLNARDAFSFAVSLLSKLNTQIEKGSFNNVAIEMTFPGSIKRLEPE